MTALPLPNRLLTVGDFAALGEDEMHRWELVEGNLAMAPSPTVDHNYAALQLAVQLVPQLPADLALVPDVDLDLRLAPPEQPGWVRRPDLVVVTRDGMTRTRREGGLLRADEAVIVVEFVSPGSRRTDNVTKRGEYADAGIPHYWIVELDDPITLRACHLAGALGYQDSPAVSGRFVVGEPFPVTIDLTAFV